MDMTSPPAAQTKILVIDDSPDIIHFLVDTLTQYDYDVRGVVNGEMAAQIAQAVQPDLILLDVKMPKMSGYEVCQKLKALESTRHMPIIFISALDSTLDKLKAFEVGGVDYIIKPFQVSELLARIKTHLSLRAAQTEIQKLNQELEQRVEQRTAQLQSINQKLRQEIIERKKAEQALHKSEEQLRLVFDATNDAIWDWDIENDAIFRSNRVYDFLGWPSVPDNGYDNFIQHIHPDDNQEITAALQSHLEDGTAYDIELRLRRADGTYGWFLDRGKAVRDAQGKPIRMVGALSDINVRKQAETKLKESERRYRQLFESNPHPMWVYDLETLAFLAVNDAAINHYGYSKTEFLGMTIRDIRPPEDIPKLLRNISQVTSGLDEAGIWQHCKKDGSIINVEVTSHTLEFLGRPAEVVLAHDVTDQLQAKADLQQLNEDLEARVHKRTAQLERLNQELESFSYSVSHDLRAPLRHIHGFVNALRQQLQKGATLDDSKVAHYLDVVESSSKKMGQLIDGLLTLSRAGRRELALQTLDLRSLVDDAIDMVTPVDFRLNIQYVIGTMPQVIGDATLLKQVFNNLLSNAIKFSRDRNPAIIEIGSLEDGTIFIRDNGVGFSMDYVDQLFDAFQRLHSKHQFEGTGIGLSIVQRIVHRHNGKIWAEGSPNQGATIYFTLNLQTPEEIHL